MKLFLASLALLALAASAQAFATAPTGCGCVSTTSINVARIVIHNKPLRHSVSVGKEGHHHQHHRLCALPASGEMNLSTSSIHSYGNFRNERSSSNTNTSTTKPRLAAAIESTIHWFMKYIALSQCSSLTVTMNAASNRAILKGNIGKLSVSARNCIFRFKLLSFRRLDVYGVNLKLGYLPFLFPVLPFFLWRMRAYIQSTIITVLLLRLTGYLDSAGNDVNGNVRKQFGSVKRKMYRFIGSPRSPSINYSMAIASNDIEHSLLLRFWLRNILQSLVQNSVVGAAAAFGDAAQQGMELQREQKRILRTTPLLPGSVEAASNGVFSQDQQQQQQGGLTSALLSATSFKLKKADFMDGRVVFDAKAVLPKDEKGVSNSLQFCIRTKLAPTATLDTGGETRQQQDTQETYNNALGFLTPECRLATNPLVSPMGGNPLLRNLIPNLIPEYLWLPFGMGVAVPLGKNCQIYRAEVAAGKENSDCICKIDGSVNVN